MKGDFMNRWISFMPNNNSLISFSIISSSWEIYHKDTFDMLTPFVLYCIKEIGIQPSNYVSIPETKQFLANEFGIKIYSNVLELVFQRLKKEEYLKFDRKTKAYILSEKEIDISEFKNKRDGYAIKQNLVLDKFFTSLKDKNISFDEKNATDAIISYLCKYGKDVISGNVDNQIADGDVWKGRVGRFINEMATSKSNIFEYIQDIAKGGMIASVVFQNDNNFKETKNFKNTNIYFDTPLLMHILGYSGITLMESVKEMTSLLIKHGARLYYFRHNLDELEGILDAYVNLYNRNQLNTSYNFDYFIENDVKPERISEYKSLLVKNLQLEKLILVDTPDYDDYSKNINWTDFTNYISNKINYNDPKRLDNDVSSIASIYRLRKYDRYTNYENCNALFVTTNSSLSYYTNYYFKENGKSGIPATVNDNFLTGMLWLKSENDNQQLPTLKIIADSLASQTLSPEFWNAFLNKVQEFEEKDIITSQEAAMLKVDIFTKRNIYDVTDGDIDKLTQSSLKEILKRNDYQRHKEEIEENEKLRQSNNEKDAIIENLSQNYIDSRSEKYINNKISIWRFLICIGNLWVIFLCLFLVILSCLANYFTKMKLEIFCNYIISSVAFPTFLKIIDKVLSGYNKGFKNAMYKKAQKILNNQIDKNEDKFVKEIKCNVFNSIKAFSLLKDIN